MTLEELYAFIAQYSEFLIKIEKEPREYGIEPEEFTEEMAAKKLEQATIAVLTL